MPQKTRLSSRLRRKVQYQRFIALLITQIWQTAVNKLVCRKWVCIIFQKTKLYCTSGFSLSEFTGKISSLWKSRLCVVRILTYCFDTSFRAKIRPQSTIFRFYKGQKNYFSWLFSNFFCHFAITTQQATKTRKKLLLQRHLTLEKN